MKRIIYLEKKVSVLLALLSFLFMISCSQEEGESYPITLAKVTGIADLSTSITEASLGDFIAIHGTGLDLQNIDSILINDVKVDLLDAYSENDILYLKIPVKLAIDVTNKIYIYNRLGCQEIPFKTNSPVLKLDRMFNEYTNPGDTIMIYGDFFELYEIDSLNAIVDFNGKISKVIASGNNYLTAQVPKDVEDNIKVKVKGLKYDVEDRVTLNPIQPSLNVLQKGTLLSLNSEKNITFESRGANSLDISVGKVLPEQIQHIITFTRSQGLGDVNFNTS